MSNSMRRSRGSVASSLSWLGEQAQTQFLDINLENHQNRSKTGSPYPSVQRLNSYNSLDFDEKHTIRHQIIVWSVGIPDVKSHTVTIMFRVTLFWNDPPPNNPISLIPPSTINTHRQEPLQHRSNSNASMNEMSPKLSSVNNMNSNGNNNTEAADDSYWVMDGRRKAVRRKRSQSINVNDTGSVATVKTEEDTIDVPPISIINADTFEIVGSPDVTLLRKKSRLMRFSCMYRARLQQESMNVSQFPHDSHDLVLKLGILAQRQPGGRWDRRKWKLGLANESDTQGSVRFPFGVLVDHVRVPGFQISDRGLEFELAPLDYGRSATLNASTIGGSGSNLIEALNNHHDQDFCVKAKIRVKRNSAYYDRNIMPLLDILNLVSISILVSLDANNFFQRGLLCLNIAFVEVGLRTSLDARLPTVGYEIKMQKLLNSYFFSILYIVLESASMKVLVENHNWPIERTRIIDHLVAFFLLVNQFYLRMIIYKDFSVLNETNEFNYY
mmetsp:Transcript_4108/g.9789  ORF Transcript_4108/g.9789 Transcript_4108/m.9789 type:complete len:498 (-) Transcript_4108:186-1679(-)